MTRVQVRAIALFVATLAAVAAVAAVRPGQAHAARSCNNFDFDFDIGRNSTLTLKWIDGLGRCVYSVSVRAGSGNGTTDPCAKNAGRLPSGWYDSPTGMTEHFGGSKIQGRVWRLDDKNCSNGTLRDELFIHSEETSSNTQICTSSSDDPWCWDSTRACPSCPLGTNDYYSVGCIKVRRDSPEGTFDADLHTIHSAFHQNITSAHNAARSDLLYVHVG